MNKKDLVKQLNDLAEWETNPFKKRAYFKAGQRIADMEEAEFNSRTHFEDIEGIGDAINKKILQFKETGFVKKWNDLFGANRDENRG
jgi:DNA polymerase/3'-5' exonuclease PolX